MDSDKLNEINRRRRLVGKRDLTPSEARQTLAAHPRVNDPGFDMTGFLIGMATGVPIGPQGVTGASLIGMAVHQSPAAAEPARHDNHSSSYDSGSSSSSFSYDSGSSSGGGFDGGGGSSAP